MLKNIFLFPLVLFFFNITVHGQTADFNVPDTVCIGNPIQIQNTSSGGSTYYWNFCTGNLSIVPSGINFGNIGSLDRPVYSAIAKDGSNFYMFITNNGNGSITRLAFGNNLGNTPVATNLGNFGIGKSEEGIEVKKDNLSGNWYALIVEGGNVDNLFRLNFGKSLNNIPTIENLGNVGNLMSYGHTIYTFSENGNWYSFIGNYWGNSILRLSFGNSLANLPTTISLGNIGGLNGPVGFYPIQENGLWYLFVVNRDNSSLSRLDFGSSLTNTPTGVNLGNALGAINLPRSISIVRDCGKVYGFVVDEGTDAIVRLTFPNGILSIPSGVALGNIADFSFPHHISELFRIGDALYAFVMNVNNNTISRLSFASCTNSTISSSNLQNPPAYSYSSPGKYNIRLVVNEGMPSQSNICKEIVAVFPPNATVTGDTSICVGETISLNTVVSDPGSTFLWTGPNGYVSTNHNVNISNADIRNQGLYTLVPSLNGCSGPAVSKNVSVFSNAFKPDITGDTSVCVGGTINLATTLIPGGAYFWAGPDNFTSTNQNISIQNADDYNFGLYTLQISKNGCSSLIADKNVKVNSSTYKPDISGDTSVCVGGTINLSTTSIPGSICFWTGPGGYTASNQSISIPKADMINSGVYTLTVNNNSCTSIASAKRINVYQISLKPDIAGDTAVCVGGSINLSTTSIPGNTYLWNGPNGLTSSGKDLSIPKSDINNSGLYTLVETQNNCLSYTAEKNVLVLPVPIVNLGQDTVVCPGNTLLLDAENQGFSYKWSTGDISQNLLVLNPGEYSVIVFDNLCSAHDTILIETCAADLWIPNVFTPNYDLFNDRFRPVYLGAVSSYHIVVFNRWGQQLYESTEIDAGWDGAYNGKQCPGGVYYFLIQYTLGVDQSKLGKSEDLSHF